MFCYFGEVWNILCENWEITWNWLLYEIAGPLCLFFWEGKELVLVHQKFNLDFFAEILAMFDYNDN